MTIKRIAAEAAALFFIAAAIGILWNRQLIIDTWSGRVTQAIEQPATGEMLPLPAGLMQVKEFYDRKEALIVDARDADTFAVGRIAGAVSVPVGEVEAAIKKLHQLAPVEKPLIVYCNGYGCHDSMTVGKALLKAGYRNVFVFEGGYPEWKEAGHPVEGTSP